MVILDEFRTDGGATWLNLLATRGQTFGAHPVERLPDPAAAQRWLTGVGLTPRDPVDEDGLELLRTLREHLRELAMAAVAGREADADAARAVARLGSAPTDAVTRGDRTVPLRAAVAAVVVSAMLTLRGPDRALLKECAESDCRWVFLDPAGRRRWCPAPACASRGRVRAHRAAARAGAGDVPRR